MKKKYLIILAVLILFSINAVSANDLNNETLSYDNSNDILSAPPRTFSDLGSEITSTPANGILELERDYTYNESADTSINQRWGIVFSRPLTIDGQGHSIDGSELSKIFTIQSISGVTLKNIVFKNANVEGNGGAIDIGTFSHNFVLDNCTFDNCVCDVYGGALNIRQSDNVKITNCDFTNNSGDLSRVPRGGAIYWFHSTGGELINCTFTNNSALYGGAVYSSECSDIVQYNNVFDSNCAQTQGGDIWTDEENAVIHDCQFSNTINGQYGTYGGSIYIKGKNSTLYNLEFNNVSGGTGGAIYCWASDSLIHDCNFTNTTTSDRGGVVLSGKNNIIRDCNFEGGKANIAAAIYTYGNNTITSNNFTNHQSTSLGGTIYLDGSDNIVNNSVIINSHSTSNCSSIALVSKLLSQSSTSEFCCIIISMIIFPSSVTFSAVSDVPTVSELSTTFVSESEVLEVSSLLPQPTVPIARTVARLSANNLFFLIHVPPGIP